MGPPLVPHPSSSLVVLGTQVIAWECGPGWKEGMREKDLQPQLNLVCIALSKPLPHSRGANGCGED